MLVIDFSSNFHWNRTKIEDRSPHKAQAALAQVLNTLTSEDVGRLPPKDVQKRNNKISNSIYFVFPIKNNNSGILRSRGHNFQLVAVENFKIYRKFAEMG